MNDDFVLSIRRLQICKKMYIVFHFCSCHPKRKLINTSVLCPVCCPHRRVRIAIAVVRLESHSGDVYSSSTAWSELGGSWFVLLYSCICVICPGLKELSDTLIAMFGIFAWLFVFLP
jgi:hypothetical protein